MMSRSRGLRLPLYLSIVALLAGCGGSSKPAKTATDESSSKGDQAEVGKPAPDLSIQTLNGKGKISLESVQGKLLVIDFWATWCGPCKQSFPKLEELSKKVGEKVAIVGISVDDEQKGVLEFAKENGATFAIGWDEGHAIATRWNVKNMPTTYIVDGSGKVRYIHAGYHEGETDTMAKELQTLSEEPPSATAVAKNDESKKDDKGAGDKKDVAATDKKDDSKEGDKKDATAAGDDKGSADPPKKKGGKKGGKGGGGGKKAGKKKKAST
jgi:cytochrome c biogenesis protein CcmG, thiol:disulfide interchange protein DsbE